MRGEIRVMDFGVGKSCYLIGKMCHGRKRQDVKFAVLTCIYFEKYEEYVFVSGVQMLCALGSC